MNYNNAAHSLNIWFNELVLSWIRNLSEIGWRECKVNVYTSKKNAGEAQDRTKQLEGFKDHQEGFEISRRPLNKDEWTFGFVTVT